MYSRETSNISLPAAHYNTNQADRRVGGGGGGRGGTAIEGYDAYACWKQNKTINYGDNAVHAAQSRIF